MSARRMALPSVSTALLLTALLLPAGGCQEQTEPADRDGAMASDTQDTAAAHDTVATSDDPAAATRAALPRLFSIMVGLQTDMDRISHGLWTESYDGIAAGARAVADHPMIGTEGLAKVQAALGDDIARFKAMDTHVHGLAVRLEEAAGARELDAVLETEVELRQGCVACHTAFRQRLRDAMSDMADGASEASG